MNSLDEGDQKETAGNKEQLKRLAAQSAHTVFFSFLTGMGMAFGALAVALLQRDRDSE